MRLDFSSRCRSEHQALPGAAFALGDVGDVLFGFGQVVLSERTFDVRDQRGSLSVELVFEDGAKGIVDFSQYRNRGGVFSKFNDIEYFKNFSRKKR